MPGKTDHFVIISDFKILVPCCSAHFALHNGAVRFAIAYTVPNLHKSISTSTREMRQKTGLICER